MIEPENNSLPSDPFQAVLKPHKKDKKGWSLLGGLARFGMLILIGAAAGMAGMVAQGYIYFTQSVPNVEKLRKYEPPVVTTVYADKGDLIGEFAYQKRFLIPMEQIPKELQDAFVAAEDKNFWRHAGVDKEAILRAIKKNLMAGTLKEGASTITQQVAKTFLLTPERKFTRKIKEAILSTRIEQSLSKEQILYLYLNQIYLGSSAYGVEAAAQTYFDKHAKDMTIAECAMLAGLAKAPSSNSPKRNLKKAIERRSYVLKRMLEDGCITEAQYEQANQEEPKIYHGSNPNIRIAADFVEHVRRHIERKYGSDALYKEGLQIYTTVSLDLTKSARDSMDVGLRELDKREGYRGPIKTLNVKGVLEFLEEKSKNMEAPLRFGDVTEGVVTHLDSENVYVRLGTYEKDGVKKDYLGQIKIEGDPKWWVRQPFIRTEQRTRNFAPGELPFHVGDLIQVRILDPNPKRRDLYMRKFGKTDSDMKNYKEYTEEMSPYFLLAPEQEPLVQSALMLRENRNGYVRVLLGGYSYSESKYNRAIQSRRQAGSSFKPVIYAAAIDKGFTASDIIMDTPLALTVPGTGEVWRPKNYRGGYLGPVTFRDCLVKSRNIPTIKILQQIGIDYTKNYAKKLGYTSSPTENLTMALGSTGVSLEEQLLAYSVFPNRGYLAPHIYVKKVVDRHGKVLEENLPPVFLDDPVRGADTTVQKISLESDRTERNYGQAQRRIDPATAYIMTSLMQGVIQEGTATNLKKIVGRPDVAGKTGTTNENIDAWFVGFSPDYTCGVWVGFDDEVSIGDGETGGKAAAPIWGYFMKQVLKDVPVKDFAPPSNVEFRRVDPRTGILSSSNEGFQEIFKVGSGPTPALAKPVRGSAWDYPGADLDQF
ncbi:MAG: PBP1A family penicillin-binding protein [Deltaproteobacteria bacterium]|nr:PBP1A family penicillin-binding protein [Deltaproteobacteria bacterium]